MNVAGVRRIAVRKANPLCGDVIDLTVGVEGEHIAGIEHLAHACSLVRTSAEVLERQVPGLTIDAALGLAERIEAALRSEAALPEGSDALAPALLLPARRRCVLLPWEALRRALSEPGGTW